jgi:hypothetical protein
LPVGKARTRASAKQRGNKRANGTSIQRIVVNKLIENIVESEGVALCVPREIHFKLRFVHVQRRILCIALQNVHFAAFNFLSIEGPFANDDPNSWRISNGRK